MAKVYTNLYEAIKDVEFYFIVRTGGLLNLSHVAPIAQNRWPWIVANWNSLKKRFTVFANGDESKMGVLEKFDREVTSYNLGNSKLNPLQSLNNTIDFSPFLEIIPLQELNLTPDELVYRDNETLRISLLDLDSFRQMLDFIRKDTAIYAQTIGLGDQDAARLLQIANKPKQRNPKTSDLISISETNKFYSIIEGIIFDIQTTQKRTPDLLTAANSNIAADSGILIDSDYQSYTTVPFEVSLESMAKKYLGSEKKWYELATVNNLKPPFIDEVGTKLPLLSPAAVNNLIISSSKKDSVFVGTKVGIGSHKYKEETRIVERIIVNENDTMVLFLSGKQDINRFIPAHDAFARIYAPGTTRRGNYVSIPSTIPGFSARGAATPSTDALRRLEQVFLNFGFDIARDSKTDDFIIDANGNFKFAAGFPAVRQAVLFALKTTKSELPFHPNYGVTVNIGDRFYGSTDEALVFGELLRDTLLKDRRFENVLINKISTTGTSISLDILVSLQGLNQPIPLSFIS